MKTDVRFDSAGLQLAGHFYSPDDDAAGPRAAIVVSHPASGVKEQAAGLYAQRLTALGYATLTFDAAYQGESEGMPRGLEDPAHRVEDIKAAVSFLSAHGAVDPARIGVLGICASGGYALSAAATDHRIKAVATVSGVDVARQFRHGPDGTQAPAVIQGMLDAAATARTAEARGEGVGTFPIFPASGEEALAAGGQHAFEGWEYYCTERAQHPRSAKAFTWSSVDQLASFDAFRFIDLIAPRPILMVVGSKAVTSWMASEAYIAAREPKEVCWVEGASHVSLYDKDEHVTPAIARLDPFFRANLTAAVPD
ncbi:MAG: alpha/beta fold family hydrolase [Devosia sp.]|uniref:alpha/beta hydrolase n=1 Tax=Devosia sp. TaxID=1871048 RepID=UPI00261E6EEE|nr:alpha/beta hydrolase [Devosia sp.]MDB5530520.1 alpha/beta fold family hydrolase [Devosia sp.]